MYKEIQPTNHKEIQPTNLGITEQQFRGKMNIHDDLMNLIKQHSLDKNPQVLTILDATGIANLDYNKELSSLEKDIKDLSGKTSSLGYKHNKTPEEYKLLSSYSAELTSKTKLRDFLMNYLDYANTPLFTTRLETNRITVDFCSKEFLEQHPTNSVKILVLDLTKFDLTQRDNVSRPEDVLLTIKKSMKSVNSMNKDSFKTIADQTFEKAADAIAMQISALVKKGGMVMITGLEDDSEGVGLAGKIAYKLIQQNSSVDTHKILDNVKTDLGFERLASSSPYLNLDGKGKFIEYFKKVREPPLSILGEIGESIEKFNSLLQKEVNGMPAVIELIHREYIATKENCLKKT